MPARKMERFKKFRVEGPDWLSKVALIIAVLSGVIAVLSGIVGVKNISDTNKLNEELNKLNYSPQLIVTECKLSNFKFISYDSTIIHASFFLNIDLKLKNIGNNNAHLMIYMPNDTTSGEDIFRKYKNRKQFREDIKRAVKSYYADKSIYPTKECVIHFSNANIVYIRDSTFTIHFWLVYRNDIGTIYDTYYWYRARVNYGSLVQSASILNPPTFNLDPPTFIDDNYSFHVYDDNESTKMNEDYDLSGNIKRSHISY